MFYVQTKRYYTRLGGTERTAAATVRWRLTAAARVRVSNSSLHCSWHTQTLCPLAEHAELLRAVNADVTAIYLTTSIVLGSRPINSSKAVPCHPLVCRGYARAAIICKGARDKTKRAWSMLRSFSVVTQNCSQSLESPWLISPFLANENAIIMNLNSANWVSLLSIIPTDM